MVVGNLFSIKQTIIIKILELQHWFEQTLTYIIKNHINKKIKNRLVCVRQQQIGVLSTPSKHEQIGVLSTPTKVLHLTFIFTLLLLI